MATQQEERHQLEQEIAALQGRLEELTRSLPRHSVKASQLMQIEELEEQIEQKQHRLTALEADS